MNIESKKLRREPDEVIAQHRRPPGCVQKSEQRVDSVICVVPRRLV